MTYRSRPLLDMAREQDCRAQIPGVCNRRTDTTVSCHYPAALGTGLKQPDWKIAFCCMACHDFIDARTHNDADRATRLWYWQVAHDATMEYLFCAGLIAPVGFSEKVRPFRRLSKILPRSAA